MKKTRYRDVAKSYRRNYKKETVDFLKEMLIGGFFGLIMIWALWMA